MVLRLEGLLGGIDLRRRGKPAPDLPPPQDASRVADVQLNGSRSSRRVSSPQPAHRKEFHLLRLILRMLEYILLEMLNIKGTMIFVWQIDLQFCQY